MNNLSIIIIVLNLSILLRSACCITPGCGCAPPPEMQGSIKGRIMSDDKVPVPVQGVRVEADNIDAYYGAATTDENGEYEIERLEAGTYNLTIRKMGFVNKYINNVEVKVGKVTNFSFTLERDVPKLNVEPTELDFSHNIEQMTFTITNKKSEKRMIWEIKIPESANWLSVSKKQGVLGKGEELITVSVERDKMPSAGNYATNLIVKSTNGGGMAEIAVTAKKK